MDRLRAIKGIANPEERMMKVGRPVCELSYSCVIAKCFSTLSQIR